MTNRKVAVTPEVAYARDLTDRIKYATEQLYTLLLQAQESECWRALGYRSWRDYITGEFDFTANYAYRLVSQARIERQIAEVLPTGNSSDGIHVSEREARDIAPLVGEVVEDVRERVEAGAEPREAVRAAVSTARESITRVGREPVTFADEEPDYGHVHECRICGVTF